METKGRQFWHDTKSKAYLNLCLVFKNGFTLPYEAVFYVSDLNFCTQFLVIFFFGFQNYFQNNYYCCYQNWGEQISCVNAVIYKCGTWGNNVGIKQTSYAHRNRKIWDCHCYWGWLYHTGYCCICRRKIDAEPDAEQNGTHNNKRRRCFKAQA